MKESDRLVMELAGEIAKDNPEFKSRVVRQIEGLVGELELALAARGTPETACMTPQEAIRRLSTIVQLIAGEYKGYLPHENSPGEFTSKNPHLSSDTRTRLMHVEDAINKACAIEARFVK